MAKADAALVTRIEGLLQHPIYFRDVLVEASDQPYRAILLAWSDIRSRQELARDEFGRYWSEKK
jgi:hypothetical protein